MRATTVDAGRRRRLRGSPIVAVFAEEVHLTVVGEQLDLLLGEATPSGDESGRFRRVR